MPARRATVRLTAAGGAALLLTGLVTAPARAAPPAPRGLVVRHGMTQPVFAAGADIKERVWVQTPVDSDHDGRLDRVAADVTRPAATADGLKVASIVEATPYAGGLNDIPDHGVDVDRLPQDHGRTSFGLRAAGGDSRADSARNALRAAQAPYTAAGYATITAQTVGSADSQGCPTSGDMSETRSAEATIQWLHGDATAYTAATGGTPVKATWSTGNSALMGVSYDGTLPEMVATTGVPGLKTIVPISAISSWYDYYRANGLVVAPGGYQGEDTDILAEAVAGKGPLTSCAAWFAKMERDQDRTTGDYTRYWAARDYTGKVKNVRASVFLVHGINDWNVKTQNFSQFWAALARYHVPRKIWLHQGGHGGPGGDTSYTLPDGTATNYTDTVHRWMDHWLYGIDNGVMSEPTAVIQREDKTYHTYANWPDPATRPVRMRLGADGTLGGRGGGPAQGFTDDGRDRTAEQLAAAPGTADPNRLAYTTAALPQATRLSGTPTVDLRMSVDNRNDANVTALLVDYAPDGTAKVVTRGWIDPQNRVSAAHSLPVRQGAKYALRFGLQPKDYVFPAGHRAGVVVISTDHDYTLRPSPGTHLTLDPSRSSATLPLVR
ncbi:MAG TPA: Xaa-Pro dipeptidyl-peptidase [Streptosporangiaceae bacterium]|jgi:X-Pro dipeptidyl-peptidase